MNDNLRKIHKDDRKHTGETATTTVRCRYITMPEAKTFGTSQQRQKFESMLYQLFIVPELLLVFRGSTASRVHAPCDGPVGPPHLGIIRVTCDVYDQVELDGQAPQQRNQSTLRALDKRHRHGCHGCYAVCKHSAANLNRSAIRR